MMTIKNGIFLVLFFLLILPGGVLAVETVGPVDRDVQLTNHEKEWLADHPVISVAPDPDFPPIEWFDPSGAFKGLAADFIALVENKLNIKFKTVHCRNWNEVIAKAKGRQIDFLSAASPSGPRREYLDFTRPHIVLPGMIFVRDDIPGTLSTDQLRGKQITVVSQYVWQDYLNADYPDIALVPAASVADGLKMVSFGRVDAMVGDMATATHYLQKEGITNLRVAGQTKYYTYLSFASRNDWPELNGILEKALASITPDESAAIMDRWIGLKHKPFIGSTKFWAILTAVFAGLLLIFAFIVAWNRSLKRLVNLRTNELSVELFERKQAEERYRDLFENANVMIQRVAPDGRFEHVNQKWLDALGYTKEELPQLTIWDIIHPDDMDHCRVIFKNIFSGDSIENLEVTFITKDGRSIPVEGNVSCHYVDGQPVSTRSIFKDISDRKRADAERKNLEAQLQRAQKMEAIGTLAGGVAHDLNNVLSGVVSYPDLILMQLPPDSPYRKSIAKVKESGLKAAAIVQDLLTLARRGAADKTVVNLNQIILEYLDSPEFEKLKEFHPGVSLHTKLEKDLFNVYGSGLHLSKTIMNLVSNAAEAIEKTGEVWISTQNIYIEDPITGYETIQEGEYALLAVSDNGAGISQEDRDRIFDPFFSKKKMGRSGTGLGMTVVWGTVKDHDGYIDIQSSGTKGTRLMLYFPISRKALADNIAKPLIDVYRGRGESILVVDDVESQREIATKILTQLGYSVATASSGEEAVAYLQSHQADLLLLDMIMEPGIDGCQTYRQILKRHPHQKAVITSGYSESERVRECQRLGAGAYVKKPYTLEKIAVAVRAELDRKIATLA